MICAKPYSGFLFSFLLFSSPVAAFGLPPLLDSENLIANASIADITAKTTVDDAPAASPISISAEPVTFMRPRSRLFGLVKVKYPRQTPTDEAYLYATVSRTDGSASVQMRFFYTGNIAAPQNAQFTRNPAPAAEAITTISTIHAMTSTTPGQWAPSKFGPVWSPPSELDQGTYGVNIPLALLKAEAAFYPQDKYHYLPVFLGSNGDAGAPNFKLYPSEAAAFLKILNDERAKVTDGK